MVHHLLAFVISTTNLLCCPPFVIYNTTMIRSSVAKNVVKCCVLIASQQKCLCLTTASAQYASSIHVTFALTQKCTKHAGIVMLFFAIAISRISKLPVIFVRRCTVPHASLNIVVSIVFVGTSIGVRNALIQNVLLVALWELEE
jgi:RsiW-degrading membrane proteinase PrsW (M82 family)